MIMTRFVFRFLLECASAVSNDVEERMYEAQSTLITITLQFLFFRFFISYSLTYLIFFCSGFLVPSL